MAAKWRIRATPQVRAWIRELSRSDPTLAAAVNVAIDQLALRGPGLGRPLVDTVQRSRHPNMKELRPRSGRCVSIRVLFAFDPQRQAVLLVAGNKAGNWRGWYLSAIAEADDLFDVWLKRFGDDGG